MDWKIERLIIYTSFGGMLMPMIVEKEPHDHDPHLPHEFVAVQPIGDNLILVSGTSSSLPEDIENIKPSIKLYPQ